MKYKVGYIIFVFLLSVGATANAQVDFNFNGLGRAIVTTNKLGGTTLANDSLSSDKGLSGYALFDLQPNLVINKAVRANAILPLRNPFGSFFGSGTTFAFRQFQIAGRIGKKIDYEFGDIYIGSDMTKYTVYNPNEIYNTFESDIHKNRRNVLEYENFVQGNQWRLQGAKASTAFDFNKIIERVGVNVFGTRTNATNERGIPDRLLVGGRVGIKQSEYLSLGLNYVNLADVKIKTEEYEHSNSVITGDVKLTLDREKILAQIDGEFGMSNFKNVQIFDDSTVQYKDNVTDVGLKVIYKPLKLKLFSSYRVVGAQFSSPSAQTARLNVDQSVWLFNKLDNNNVNRNLTLYDRLTDEHLYNRSISAVLYNYLPQYGNLSPFGDATPNRAGITVGLGTDTSTKIINAEARIDMFNELIGEGVVEKRKFTSLRGGVVFNFSELIKLKRRMSVNVGVRQENTTRAGLASIDFKSMLMDYGVTIETFKGVDFLFGAKSLTAKGNEYLSMRDNFNLLVDFPVYELDLKETIYSIGARVRFSERSYFMLNYNTSTYNETKNYNFNYNFNQLFCNYTLIF